MNDISQPRRLYLDNAATSFPKPQAVTDAMVRYATEVGASAGRGAYREAIECQGLLAECRRRLNRLFNGENPDHFVFALNCSDALNLAIKGLMQPGRANHVICTQIDHNSVLRPLSALAAHGVAEVTRVRVDPATGLVDPDDVRRAVRSDTRLICITHASNVTGTVQDLPALTQVARQCAVPMLVDAAQSVGHLDIDVQRDAIDLLAAPGHKGLLGPLGTGFLYIRPGLEKLLRPVREGGTGSVSEEDVQPSFMPDKYESGSHNAIGIAGLSEGVAWVLKKGIAALQQHDRDLVRTFIDGVSSIPTLGYFGPQGVKHRMGVFSVRVEGLNAHELAAALESQFGILTRPGLHCAPHAHAAIGTLPGGGTTRLSFGPFLSTQDVKFACDALSEVAAGVTA